MKINVSGEEIEIEGKMNVFLYFLSARNIGVGKTGLIREFLSNSALGLALLKLFGIASFWWFVVLIGLVYEVVNTLFGVWLIQKGITRREGWFSNLLGNPDMLKVKEKLGIK